MEGSRGILPVRRTRVSHLRWCGVGVEVAPVISTPCTTPVAVPRWEGTTSLVPHKGRREKLGLSCPTSPVRVLWTQGVPSEVSLTPLVGTSPVVSTREVEVGYRKTFVLTPTSKTGVTLTVTRLPGVPIGPQTQTPEAVSSFGVKTERPVTSTPRPGDRESHVVSRPTFKG